MLRIEKVIVICREVNRQTGQIAVYFPALAVGGVVPAMYFRQSSTCAGVMPCARSQSASRSSSFAVVSFMASFLLLSGYSACGVRLCAASLAVPEW